MEKEDFPDLLSCKVMPQVDTEVSEVVITDAEGNVETHYVPVGAVRSIPMSHIAPNVPEHLRKPFEVDAGLGLLACRVLQKTSSGLSLIEIPERDVKTISIIVPSDSLARRRGNNIPQDATEREE